MINIRVGTELVMLGPQGRHEARDCPFGIEVTPADWDRIRRGLRAGSLPQQWWWSRDECRFSAGGSIVLDDVTLDGVDANQNMLGQSTSALGSSAEDLHAATPVRAPDHGLLGHYGFVETSTRGRAAAATLAGEGALEDVLWLLGRGPGLTPSGDDALVGMLAVLTVAGEANHRALRSLSRALEGGGKPWTTEVSLAYLRCALRAEFSLSVTQVATAFGDQQRLDLAVRQLVQHGHTSGVDVLLGMTCALELLDAARST